MYKLYQKYIKLLNTVTDGSLFSSTEQFYHNYVDWLTKYRKQEKFSHVFLFLIIENQQTIGSFILQINQLMTRVVIFKYFCGPVSIHSMVLSNDAKIFDPSCWGIIKCILSNSQFKMFICNIIIIFFTTYCNQLEDDVVLSKLFYPRPLYKLLS